MVRGGSAGLASPFTKAVAAIGDFTISQGPRAGQKFELLPWQKQFLKGALAPGVTRSALSMGRANGKSAFCAALACLWLGPLAEPRGEVLVLASSFEQGRKALGEQALHYLGGTAAIRERGWRVEDNTAKFSITTDKGSRLTVMAADARRAHGRPGVVAALLDESAQWSPGVGEKLLAAITTSAGKQENFKIIALGTRPASPEHWFSRWLAGAADYVQTYAAPDDAKPYQRKTWKLANPSLRHFPHLLEAIKAEAVKAKADDAELASFKALRLNQGTPETERQSLLDASVWRSCQTLTPPEASGNYVLSLDLGTNASMSAAAAYWPSSGRLESLAAFPDVPGLAERGASDHVGDLYVRMAEKQELIQAGGRVVDIADFLGRCVESFGGAPSVVVADRWRQAELLENLEASGIPPCELVSRGMGWKDGAEDVRGFRRACIDGRVKTKPTLLLTSALAEAVVVSDPAGNQKLSKGSEGGRRKLARDDSAAAAILAVSEGLRRSADSQPKSAGVYLGMV